MRLFKRLFPSPAGVRLMSAWEREGGEPPVPNLPPFGWKAGRGLFVFWHRSPTDFDHFAQLSVKLAHVCENFSPRISRMTRIRKDGFPIRVIREIRGCISLIAARRITDSIEIGRAPKLSPLQARSANLRLNIPNWVPASYGEVVINSLVEVQLSNRR